MASESQAGYGSKLLNSENLIVKAKTMLKYKASARERWYVEVDETNTTRTCSGCLSIPASAPKGVKGLSIREWVCCECGAIHDRDINAALNILRIGCDTLASEVR